MKETAEIEARQKQSKKSKRATLDMLKSKKRATRVVEFSMDGENTSMEFRAIGAVEYDKLTAKHPPTPEQRIEGSSTNINTFGPALLSKTCVDPEISEEEWLEIWNSPEWSRGEIVDLYLSASALCNQGLDVPLSESD